MRAYRLCLMAGVAALALSLSASVAFSQVSDDTAVATDAVSEVVGTEYVYSPYGEAGFGFTPFGFRRLAPRTFGGYYFPSVVEQCPPYEQSYYEYSPTRYGTDPCAQWTFRGCFLHIPIWEYTPQLIPPRPHRDFHCCHNSGLCTPEMPCCPLCNINGCCDRERAIEAGEDYVPNSNQNPSLAPVPVKSANDADDSSMGIPTTSTDDPAETDTPEEPADNGSEDDAAPNSLMDSVNSSKVKTSQVSWSKPNPDGTPSNRLSNIDVRASRGVIFTIWAPNQAKVYVNGAPTTSIGSKRTFASVNLKPGLKYQYVIDAVVEKDGKTYTESKTIVVSAGDVKTIAFAFPELNSIPSDEWSGEGF
ncbi:MAG: TIGR03000 domain-containing protein [Thermoguttaceae bacterium]|nr:TIGR03000 domain-containing protein [Thermoguttaceae bacterium]